MSSENSSTKWIVGCLVAAVVGMFMCGGAIVLVGLFGYRAAQQVAQQIGPEFQKQIAEMQFASEWRPPAEDAGAEELFPETIGAWVRVGHDDAAAIPELAIEKDGLHGAYESAGTKVDVYAYHLPQVEEIQVFDGALAAIESAGYSSKSHTQVDYGIVRWLTFSFAPPERHGRLWWANEWLIVTVTDNSGVNLEGFERDYVLAIQGPPLPGTDQLIPSQLDEFTPPEPQEPAGPAAPAEPILIDPAEPVSPTEPALDDPNATETAPADPDPAPADPDSATE